MVQSGSARTATTVAIVLSLLGCGGGVSEAKAPEDEQGTEMTRESGFGGERTGAEEDIEPADHDIEVPPAP